MVLNRIVLVVVIAVVGVVQIAAGTPPVVDGHSHEGLSWRDGSIDTSGMSGLAARGIQVVVFGLPVDRSPTADIEERIRGDVDWLRQASTVAADFAVVDDPGVLLSGVPDDGVQVVFAIEWFKTVFGPDPAVVGRYRDLGVRVIGLVEDDPDGLFHAGDGSETLSPYGRQIIHAMNEAEIVIDITHLSHLQMLQVIAYSRVPVVASHSNAQAVTPGRSNLPDEVIEALAEHGGAVWVSFNSAALVGDGGEDVDAVDRLIDHIDYLVERLGAHHVGIGTDLQAGGKYVPAALNTNDSFAAIGRRLEERGYPADVVDEILGENVLRALGRLP